MGRIADLCGEVAAAADEGAEGLVLSVEAWDRLREDWKDEEIEDALAFVRDSLLQGELVDAADSLSAELLTLLGTFGTAAAFARPGPARRASPSRSSRGWPAGCRESRRCSRAFATASGPTAAASTPSGPASWTWASRRRCGAPTTTRRRPRRKTAGT